MAKHKLLSTKKLDASVRAMAEENGIDLIEIAFISLQPLRTAENRKKIQDALKEKEVVAAFTSRHAVDAVAGEISATPPWKIFCLSGKTRQAIEEKGWGENIITATGDAASLAEEIIRHEVKRMVFFCGDKRRETLPEKLQKAGIACEEIVVYENNALPVVFAEKVEGIMFFSPTAVESFFSLNQVTEETCFAIGAATAEALRKYSQKIITASTPGQEELMQLVIRTIATKDKMITSSQKPENN